MPRSASSPRATHVCDHRGADSAAPLSARERLALGATAAAAGLAGLYGLACIAAALWLRHAVPLDARDLADASWLSSYTTATHLSGLLGTAMTFAGVLMALAIAVSRQSAVPLLMAVVVALGAWANQEDTLVRAGVLAGHVRIGCFIPEARECREMLRLPLHEAPSRYNPLAEQAQRGLNAPWYEARLASVDASARDAALWHSLPGVSLLSMPWVAAHADLLRERLRQQRAEVAALRSAEAVPSARP